MRESVRVGVGVHASSIRAVERQNQSTFVDTKSKRASEQETERERKKESERAREQESERARESEGARGE